MSNKYPNSKSQDVSKYETLAFAAEAGTGIQELDLHGAYRDEVQRLLVDFLEINIRSNKPEAIIINHGLGGGVVSEEVRRLISNPNLSKLIEVLYHRPSNLNPGNTIVIAMQK